METIEIGTKAIANSLAALVATHNIRWVASVVTSSTSHMLEVTSRSMYVIIVFG